jgi:hypothetical protein
VTGTSDIAHRLQLEEISEKLLSPSSGKKEEPLHWTTKRNFFSSLGKLSVSYINLTLLNPNTANKIFYYRPILREKSLNSKVMFLIKNLMSF